MLDIKCQLLIGKVQQDVPVYDDGFVLDCVNSS